MKRWWSLLLLTLFPILAIAAESPFTPPSGSSMSFSPPPGDYSVMFLGNIFGVVDGVLHGNGSQIMGVMLGIFNSAVLALGGIVIMYIILVSTLNTAHEGEMLGHKWSSIWVPVRTVIGLTLLIPKASGYCMMQIFVMWVVVQGVGVADKIWGAALDYLNRGGVIIKADMSPQNSMFAGKNSVVGGSAVMLYGQVCMLGLQTQLENAREVYLEQANSNVGPCAGTPSAKMQSFCNTAVPDFISTVDPLARQMEADDQGSTPTFYFAEMPHFDSGSIYSSLNGICGVIKWNPVSTAALMKTEIESESEGDFGGIQSYAYGLNGSLKKPKIKTTTLAINSLTDGDLDMIKMTRGMAVSQMYTTLESVARLMVGNDPQITINNNSGTSASLVATDQFGVPQTSGYTTCSNGDDNCPNWGADASLSSSGVLLQGTEFQGAISDYNAVMAATLKLMHDAENANAVNRARQFIQTSKQSGWILAGSYFFNLVKLNGNASGSTLTDEGSGLDQSEFDITAITAAFGERNLCNSTYQDLCIFFNKNPTRARQVVYLIDGSGQAVVTQPNLSATSQSSSPVQTGTKGSTVYGYVNNAMDVDLPTQPGLDSKPKIKLKIDEDLHFNFPYRMSPRSFSGCIAKPMGYCISVNALVGNIYSAIILSTINSALTALSKALEFLSDNLVSLPIKGFTYIFSQGVDTIAKPGVNPIVALAAMGINLINYGMTIWLGVAVAAAAAGAIPFVGPAAVAILALFMPIFIAVLGVMLSIGFMTAYYVPFLPYMLFTFGAIGWLITVIEAMVASPIVALGIAHPEGHDALGKSEQGLMILMNVFLRPPMMVIGFIAGISLSYVGVWILNAGFQNVLDFMQGSDGWGGSQVMPWAKIFGYFMASLLYTTTYLTIVQKAFTLIAVLPDKVLRWIGGQAEQTGQETSQWAEEGKSQMKEAGEKLKDAGGQTTKQIAGHAGTAASTARSGLDAAGSALKGGIAGLTGSKPKPPPS